MKADSEHQKFATFAGCLVVIAVVVNSLFFLNSNGLTTASISAPERTPPALQQPPSQSPPTQSQPFVVDTTAADAAAKNTAAAKAAAEEAAAERAAFLARYLNGNPTRQAGKQGVAIVVENENGKLNPAATTALAHRLQSETIQTFPSFFTSAFISDGFFDDALVSSDELFRKLDLASSLSALVLAREDVQYSKNAALENVITATMRLDVTVVPVVGQANPMTWTFTAYGPGFTKDIARGMAEERIIKQISSDTKMSLTDIIPINQNH